MGSRDVVTEIELDLVQKEDGSVPASSSIYKCAVKVW